MSGRQPRGFPARTSMTATEPNVPIRPAATILLIRDAPTLEVLMVKRHHETANHAGALVFPGGKTHAGDHDGAWARRTLGWEATPAEERALRIAAVREVYEEAGVLLARDSAGQPFAGDERAAHARNEVMHDARSFLDLVQELDVMLDLSALTAFARWITPSAATARFDTWFYLARAESEQLASCDGWETVDVQWIEPGEAIRLAALGERRVVFPTRMNLKRLAESTDTVDALARAARRPLVAVQTRVEERPEGRMLVLPPEAGYGEVAELISTMS